MPGDSAGGGGVPSAGTPMAAPGPLPTGASPTIGQGIVSRDTVDTTGQMKTAFSEALNEAPVKTAVVVDQGPRQPKQRPQTMKFRQLFNKVVNIRIIIINL